MRARATTWWPFRDARARSARSAVRPHRRASLFLGGSEECGLGGVYHGWKLDPGGRSLDIMMNEQAEAQFKNKVFVASSATVELDGLASAYMGQPGRQPALPGFA